MRAPHGEERRAAARLEPWPGAPMRSYLFVPADSERKLAKGAESGADALILDLEDSVAPDRKAGARDTALTYLKQHGGARAQQLVVRVNALDTGLTDADLDV